MEMHEIQQKDEKELYGLLNELSAKRTDLEHKAANGKLTEVHTLSQTRKTIARIKTALNARKTKQQ